MRPAKFPQADTVFDPPTGIVPSMQKPISGHRWNIEGGRWDGAECVVVAWRPSQEDLLRLMRGEPVYLTMFGGIAPHKMTTSFGDAVEK